MFGLVGLPLAFRLLGNLPDRGYAFARPLGLLLTGYLLWLGGSLGFLRNSVGGTLVAMLLVAGVGIWLYFGRRNKEQTLLGWLRAHKTYWVTVELLFVAFPEAMESSISWVERYEETALTLKAALAVAWQVTGWWIVVLCFRGLPAPERGRGRDEALQAVGP